MIEKEKVAQTRKKRGSRACGVVGVVGMVAVIFKKKKINLTFVKPFNCKPWLTSKAPA
jgi:hypothetical protein